MGKVFDSHGYLASGFVFLLVGILTWPTGAVFVLPAVFLITRFGVCKASKVISDERRRRKFVKGCYISTGAVVGFGFCLIAYGYFGHQEVCPTFNIRFLSIDGIIQMFIGGYILVLGLLAGLAVKRAAKAYNKNIENKN
jgi:hypothetical protein